MFITKLIRSFLARFGYQIVHDSILYDWQKGLTRKESNILLPEGAAEYLRVDNSRLMELRQRYSEFQSEASTPIVWTDEYVQSHDLLTFRGDNCYVWQSRDPNCDEINYCLTAYYIQANDTLGLLKKNREDGYFGAHTYSVASHLVSRDLLDSINELHFLEQQLELSKLSRLNILDIGAGYGRLAYRTVCSLPNVSSYTCTDAVPESTFISEYHIRYRQVKDKVSVIPLDEIEKHLEAQPIDLAINIHSFSECSMEAIDWWVALLAKYSVPYLFIVPNGSDHGGEKLALNSGEDFSAILTRHGYTLMVKKPKYSDPMVQRMGVSPTHYYIFERKAENPGTANV